MGQSTYSLEGNGADLSKIYPSGGTNYFSSAVTTTAHYMHVVPNSHFWTNLKQLTDSIEFGWLNADIGKEFIIIGLQNTIKNGYKLKIINDFDPDQLYKECNDIFYSIDDMIEYVKSAQYKEAAFYTMLLMTIKLGFDLTNGLKMERTEIYKRIDGERNYQDANWGTRRQMDGTPDEEKPVAEWINYIEFHVQKAKNAVYYLNTLKATDELRKVAALAVRAMEIHGCPMRDVVAEPKDTTCCDGDCECKK